jgi:hypothetical protein
MIQHDKKLKFDQFFAKTEEVKTVKKKK